MIEVQSSEAACDRPARGWHCKLPHDHEGPCPAYPTSGTIQAGIVAALEAKDVVDASALMHMLALEDPDMAEAILEVIDIFTKRT